MKETTMAVIGQMFTLGQYVLKLMGMALGLQVCIGDAKTFEDFWNLSFADKICLIGSNSLPRLSNPAKFKCVQVVL